MGVPSLCKCQLRNGLGLWLLLLLSLLRLLLLPRRCKHVQERAHSPAGVVPQAGGAAAGGTLLAQQLQAERHWGACKGAAARPAGAARQRAAR